jgi:hypothetical protein
LVRFVGDGSNDLLGYCNNFSLQNQELMKICNTLTTTNISLVEKVTRQKETITEMEKEISKSKEKQTMLGLRRRRKTLSNVERLSIGGGALKRRIKATRYSTSFIFHYIALDKFSFSSINVTIF